MGKTIANLFKRSSSQNQYAVIFIHGFTGHHEDTWRKDRNSTGLIEAVIHDNELKGFDVYSFAYGTGLSIRQYDFKAVAGLLYSKIQADIPNHNLIFVTHSMGGLAAQQYILDRYEDFDKQNLNKIKGIVFLGVPFEGSKWAKFPFNKQIKSLAKDNPLLLDLKNNWQKYVTRGGMGSLPSDLQHNFHRLSIIGVRDGVVTPDSSNPFHIDAEHVFEVDDTHTSLCKGDEKSPTFKHIKKLLLDIINEDKETMILGINGYDKRTIESADYTIDWSDYFDITSKPRKLPDIDAWERYLIPTIKPSLDMWNERWAHKGGKIRFYGKFCLTGGLLVGSRFSRTKGVKLEVEHYSAIWKGNDSDPSFKATPNYSVGNSDECNTAVVILSVTNNIQNQVKDFLTGLADTQYKQVVNILPPNGTGRESIKNERQAVAYAIKVKETIDSLQSQGIKEILMFINAPLSLAVITGHWLTATCPIQTFEYDGTGYVHSCKI
ncbi:alpha/beta fold hydrolase [Pseudobacillus badius]|uniref:alpha/beta fold hydrolase n=1 Tax=Bacillus badius TaxID=1455 RepID=UPI003D3316BF